MLGAVQSGQTRGSTLRGLSFYAECRWRGKDSNEKADLETCLSFLPNFLDNEVYN